MFRFPHYLWDSKKAPGSADEGELVRLYACAVRSGSWLCMCSTPFFVKSQNALFHVLFMLHVLRFHESSIVDGFLKSVFG